MSFDIWHLPIYLSAFQWLGVRNFPSVTTKSWIPVYLHLKFVGGWWTASIHPMTDVTPNLLHHQSFPIIHFASVLRWLSFFFLSARESNWLSRSLLAHQQKIARVWGRKKGKQRKNENEASGDCVWQGLSRVRKPYFQTFWHPANILTGFVTSVQL